MIAEFEQDWINGKIKTPSAEIAAIMQAMDEWISGRDGAGEEQFYHRIKLVRTLYTEWLGEPDAMEPERYRRLFKALIAHFHHNRRDLERQLAA